MVGRHKRKVVIPIIVFLLLLSGCASKNQVKEKTDVKPIKNFAVKEMKSESHNGVYYEIFVRSFADSNKDGIGDLNGVTNKLDYLKALGVQGIWLMPILKSPSYHGYDTTDYYTINPDYGTEQDLKNLVSEAHKRGIKVVMDLVVNHTGDQNEWFQKALAGDKKYRNYYIWQKLKDDPTQLGDWGSPVWQTNGDQVYEGIFASSMPDLNYDNPEVRKEMINVGQYWLKNTALDGFRLDAAKHIYSNWQYPENAADLNYQWWNQFYTAMKQVNPNTFLVGEVWDGSVIVGPYLKNSLTSAFNFDLSPLIISAAKGERDNGIALNLENIRNDYRQENKDFIDSTFITNHDMDRTMSQLGNKVNNAKMAASLLLTLPGNPFIYYGEEIGMNGAGPDEAKREPFIWSKNSKNKAQTSWEPYNNNNPDKIAFEVEQKDPKSLYNWYRNLIQARDSSDILMNGEIKSTNYQKNGLIIYKRMLGSKSMLIIHNMTNADKQFTLDQEDKNYQKIYFSTNNNVKIGSKVSIPKYTTLILK